METGLQTGNILTVKMVKGLKRQIGGYKIVMGM